VVANTFGLLGNSSFLDIQIGLLAILLQGGYINIILYNLPYKVKQTVGAKNSSL
jgi:hypothetical protein